MSYRMRLVLMYKDGTERELKTAVPPDVGNEIAQKGLVATRVYVDKFSQFPVPPNTIFDDFRKKP